MLAIIHQTTLSNPKDIIKSEKKKKKNYEKHYTKETTSKATTTNKFLAKFLTERKYIMNDLSSVTQKYL